MALPLTVMNAGRGVHARQFQSEIKFRPIGDCETDSVPLPFYPLSSALRSIPLRRSKNALLDKNVPVLAAAREGEGWYGMPLSDSYNEMSVR